MFNGFDGDEYFVDFANGNDSTGDGLSIGTAWKTIKHAVETGITSAPQGARVNCLTNATHTVASAIDPGNYGGSTPLILQGATTIPDDGGRATISCNAGQSFVDDVNFDACYIGDLDVSGNVTGNSYLVRIDRNCILHRSSFVNSGGQCLYIDINSTISNCWFEGSTSSSSTRIVRGTSSSNRAYMTCCVIRQTNAGQCVSFMDIYGCLMIIDGNANATAHGHESGLVMHCAAVCRGTPNASATGFESGAISSHAENFGIGFYGGSATSHVMHNSFFNCQTPWQSDREIEGQPPVDSVTSVFADAANGDFTIVPASNNVHQLAAFVGVSNNGSRRTPAFLDSTGMGLFTTSGGGGPTIFDRGMEHRGQRA